MKTISLKKVSAVAVASLGFGLLSVVPAQAATQACVVVNNAAGATTTPTVGSAVVVSVTLTCTGTVTEQNGWVGTVTPTITTSPTNKTTASVATTGITPSVATNAIPVGTGTVAVGTNTLVYTQVSASANPNAVMGTFSFTPSTSGYYVMTLTPSITTASASTTDNETFTTAVLIGINVAGGSLVQAASGLGTSTGTQAVGLNAAAAFHLPAGSTNASRYKVEATGALINAVNTITTVTDAASATTFTATTGVTTNTPSSFATGVTYAGQATTTSVLTGTTVTDGVVVAFSSATAGEAVVTIKSMSVTTGLLTTVGSVTVTFGAAPAVSAGRSTMFAGTGNAFPTADAAALVFAKTAAVTLASTATTGSTIGITVLDQNGIAMLGIAVTATISGPGLITLTSGNGTGSTGTVRAASLTAATQAATNESRIGVSADGTSGKATVTVTAGTTVLGTKDIYFYDSPATIVAVQNHKVLPSDGSAPAAAANAAAPTGATIAETPCVILTVKDKNGIIVPGVTITAKSTDTAVLSETIIVTTNAGTGAANTAAGTYNVNVRGVSAASGSKASLTFRIALTSTTYVESNSLSYSLGGGVETVSTALNKASYTPGEAAVITITAKDDKGNASADADYTNILSAALTSSLSVVKTLGATTVSTLGGIQEIKFNAPTTPGAWTVTGKTGTAPGAAASKVAAISLSATITDPNSVLLTQIDALNAKIVALNALIAKIMKKLGVK